MPYFDTHAHYWDAAFDADRTEVIESLPGAGIGAVTLSGSTLEDSRENIALARENPLFYAAVGVHPEFAGEVPGDYLATLAALTAEKKVVAIGEIGLDYHYPGYDREAQILRFREQLDLARELDLPVIVHARDCTEDYLRVLREFHPSGVVHCFSGSAEIAAVVVELGMYVGFTGVITYSNAKRAKKALASVPADRYVIETDCPYMAPGPYRGKRCDSTMLPETAAAAAEIRGVSIETIQEETYRNAYALYRIS